MRAEAGDDRVIDVSHRGEAVRPRLQRFEHGFAADAGKTHDGVHARQRIGRQARVGSRGARGAVHGGKRAIDAEAHRGRRGGSGAERMSAGVLDAGAAAAAAAIDADEQQSF